MDFSDFSSYPMVANPDYSPTTEELSYPDAFDKAYLGDAFTTRPDYSFESYLDTDSFFDHPVNSFEPSLNYTAKNPTLFNSPLTNATSSSTKAANISSWSAVNPSAPFGRLGSLSEGFSTSPTFNSVRTDSFSYGTSPPTSSPTPSICGDGNTLHQADSTSLSPYALKREPSENAGTNEEPTPKRPQRKRGRPRLDRSTSDATSTSNASAKVRTAQRLPHNQVERKYREGLNAELERLRRAVPSLIQCDSSDITAPPKPSKATILASAIDYIKKIEHERDMLLEENEGLRNIRQQ
ncbi:hypothetical protein CC78DRAFT_288130 [Lojkania enalia]|uniref:BHLH domain-containing protein n=1 Tax=Lojkania enalia TaxID=147567 RepID=A0A9P4N292_9PLEO|nr:hypothetical protein CC78DRAFT_288130 [Didymosphaeria enalia]